MVTDSSSKILIQIWSQQATKGKQWKTLDKRKERKVPLLHTTQMTKTGKLETWIAGEHFTSFFKDDKTSYFKVQMKATVAEEHHIIHLLSWLQQIILKQEPHKSNSPQAMHTGSIEEYKLPHELTPKGSGKIGPFQNFTLLKQLVKPWKIVTDHHSWAQFNLSHKWQHATLEQSPLNKRTTSFPASHLFRV